MAKMPWYMDDDAAKEFVAFDAKHPEVFLAFRAYAEAYVHLQLEEVKAGQLAASKVRLDARRIIDDIRCDLRKYVRLNKLLVKSPLRGLSNKWSHWYAAKLMKAKGSFALYFKERGKA